MRSLGGGRTLHHVHARRLADGWKPRASSLGLFGWRFCCDTKPAMPAPTAAQAAGSPSSACQIIRSWRNAKKKTDISSRVLDSTHANVRTLSERIPNPLGGGRQKVCEPVASRPPCRGKSERFRAFGSIRVGLVGPRVQSSSEGDEPEGPKQVKVRKRNVCRGVAQVSRRRLGHVAHLVLADLFDCRNR